ncbi:SDR family NAD(P)-dependent oxidoreductase [Corynebacterium flavescens]|uniref:SDR family NAD(P)-dependent oxidoreductase n=1 Tax=Corynebacterium flavescens TaxID=28028 RepID=UPI003FD6B1F4
MDLQLNDRVILVVGGRGIVGRAVVDTLRQEGAVALSSSRSPKADVQMDLADDDSVRGAIRRVLDEHGRLDGLVVSAAPPASTLDPSQSSAPDAVGQAIDTKALGFLRVANAVLPTFLDAHYGRIVGVSGQNAWSTSSIMAAARNAVLNLAAKGLADEHAGSGLTVNTVNPDPVGERNGAIPSIGAAGWSTPDQVASTITYLVSPIAGAISGESIAVGHRIRGVNV